MPLVAFSLWWLSAILRSVSFSVNRSYNCRNTILRKYGKLLLCVRLLPQLWTQCILELGSMGLARWYPFVGSCSISHILVSAPLH